MRCKPPTFALGRCNPTLVLGRTLGRLTKKFAGEECCAELVVSGGDAPELLQLIEEPLDQITLTVELFAERIQRLSIGFVGYVGCRSLRFDLGADPIGIVTLVGKHNGSAFEVLQQIGCAGRIVILSWSDQEAERPALFVDERVDFRGEPASATTHATISTPFLAPAACW